MREPPTPPGSTAYGEDVGKNGVLREVLVEGTESGAFTVEDPTLLANHMYASGLGALQLARVGMLVRESAPGVPAIAPVSTDDVKAYVVATAQALAARP